MYAAGWHETSAPLGMPGNIVLNGHNTTHGEVFRDLYTLEAGDTIIVYSGDVPYTYAVSEILILPEAGQPLEVRSHWKCASRTRAMPCPPTTNGSRSSPAIPTAAYATGWSSLPIQWRFWRRKLTGSHWRGVVRNRGRLNVSSEIVDKRCSGPPVVVSPRGSQVSLVNTL